MFQDSIARDRLQEQKEREQALIRAYTSLQGSIHHKQGTWAGGGPIDRALNATAKAIYRMSGAQDVVTGTRHPIRRLHEGDTMMFPLGGKVPASNPLIQHMEKHAIPVRAEAGRTGRAQKNVANFHQAVPPIATSKHGIPLVAYDRPPAVEEYLGNDTISLMLERMGIAKQPNPNVVDRSLRETGHDPSNLVDRRRAVEEIAQHNVYQWGPQEVEDGLSTIQELIDRAWSRQRPEAVANHSHHMHKAAELERRGQELLNSPLPGDSQALKMVAEQLLASAAKRRARAQEFAPYLIPYGVKKAIGNTIRGSG